MTHLIRALTLALVLLLALAMPMLASSTEPSPSSTVTPPSVSSTSSSPSSSSDSTQTVSQQQPSRTPSPPRKADWEDFLAAQNIAIEALYSFDVSVATYLATDPALARTYLIGNFSLLFSADSTASLQFVGYPPVIGHTPTGIVDVALSITNNLGESHTFGAFQSRQIDASHPLYTAAPPSTTQQQQRWSDRSKTVTLLLRSISSGMVKKVSGPGYVEYRTENVWVVRVTSPVSASSSLTSAAAAQSSLTTTPNREARVVLLQERILSAVDIPSSDPVIRTPLTMDNAFTNP